MLRVVVVLFCSELEQQTSKDAEDEGRCFLVEGVRPQDTNLLLLLMLGSSSKFRIISCQHARMVGDRAVRTSIPYFTVVMIRKLEISRETVLRLVFLPFWGIYPHVKRGQTWTPETVKKNWKMHD